MASHGEVAKSMGIRWVSPIKRSGETLGILPLPVEHVERFLLVGC